MLDRDRSAGSIHHTCSYPTNWQSQKLHRLSLFSHFQAHSCSFDSQIWTLWCATHLTPRIKHFFSLCLTICHICWVRQLSAAMWGLCQLLPVPERFHLVNRDWIINLSLTAVVGTEIRGHLPPSPISCPAPEHVEGRTGVCWCQNKGCALHADSSAGSS